MDALPPVIANALRGRALGSEARNVGLECLKLMGDRLLLAKGQDAEGDIDPSCALPLGANERAALWQAARWINEGIDKREPARLHDALAALHGMMRAGSVPTDIATVPSEALRCTDEELWDEVRTFCEVFGPRLRPGA
ncbi:hypothetical protein [Inquilinus limosus]|uniref:Uncharacterized protein n=1 Tax=Inquilinus limosus MP06 TaxID=1398085 RepID=A0A0A0D9D4_9PROT|nr:hypothetical protein [Inquilinus limosus]KGM35316.1 hypothetical protein P409_05235 [Inquilinus limosus MP06]